VSSVVKKTYARAGVDIQVSDEIKQTISRQVRSTFSPEVLNFGSFGSMFRLEGYRAPVLVSSVDGVGTKIRIASLLGREDLVGIDIVNHCVNDILCCGAKPLFFLDYIAMEKMVPERVEKMIAGMVQACRDAGCSLIGGESAEMPGIYARERYDLVGFVVGVVESENIIDGASIKVGDVMLGLPSSGLHTNGYSLARQVFGVEENPACLGSFYPELGETLGEALLKNHICYYQRVKPVLSYIKGIAHITGGGIKGNVSRILPQGVAACFQKGSWSIPAIFRLIQEKGNVDESEMYKAFNMGVGMILVCAGDSAAEVLKMLPEASVIGSITKSP